MVARAADGSVRDALSMLDQAIAHGAGDGGDGITADTMRDMLGLSDRARIVDLFEYIMKGDIASALGELKSQYEQRWCSFAWRMLQAFQRLMNF